MSAATEAAPAPSSGSAIDNFFKLAERGHVDRDRGPCRPDHVHGHGLHHLPEPEHPDGRVRGHRRSELHACRAGRRHGAGRRDPHDRHGPRGQLPVRARGGTRHQRDRRLLADGPGPVARWRHGRHRVGRHRRHGARHRRLPRGRDERRAARAQEGDRGRHRAVHPDHRVRRRRLRRRRTGHGGLLPPADNACRFRVLDRPDPHDRAVGAARPGGADHQHPGDHHPRPDRGCRPHPRRPSRSPRRSRRSASST